jgi:hypothetical protein
MNVVGIAANNNGLTFQIFADATNITMQLLLIRWMYKCLAIFGTEGDVEVVLNKRLAHRIRLPLAGLVFVPVYNVIKIKSSFLKSKFQGIFLDFFF